MARVPTWTELRLDAKKLARIQKECYNSVHRLLDLDIPALDRKISMLSGKSFNSLESTPSIQEDLEEEEQQQQQQQPFNHTSSIVEPVEYLPERREQDVIIPASSSPAQEARPFESPHENHNHMDTTRYTTEYRRQPIEQSCRQPETNSRGTNNYHQQQPLEYEVHLLDRKRIDLNDNPHLKGPPLPLSEYLIRNRPDVVRRATRRALYVKTRADRRKFRNETKLINSFKRLRLAANHQPAQNTHTTRIPKPIRPTNHNAPAYNVRYKLSETEMKKLTARTYKRLPEVKMRHKEEVTNQMRALNHKNKLEYARKLTENRKNGIINYPLTSSYDDRSMTSSQSEYSINSYVGSADMHRW